MKQKKLLSITIVLSMLVGLLPLAVQASGITAEYVTGNSDGVIKDYLRLPDRTEEGTKILRWESSDQQKLCVGGFDAYPLASDDAETVELTAVTEDDSDTIQVTVPAVEKSEVTLIDETFDSTESDSGLPEGWTRGAETTAGRNAISVKTDDSANPYLSVDVTSRSQKNDMFAHLNIDTSDYDRIVISYDIEVVSGEAMVWPSAGETADSDKLLGTAQSTASYTLTGTANSSANKTTIPLESGKRTVQLGIYQPNRGRGSVSLSIDGVSRSLINNGLWLEGKKLSLLPFGVERGKRGTFKIDNVHLSALQDARTVLDRALSQLDLGDLQGVEQKLSLPQQTPDGQKIFWCSSDADKLENDGTVHQGAEAQEVTLYALLNGSGVWFARAFDVQIAPLWEGGITQDDIADGTDAETGKITLPSVTRTGYRVTEWVSSNPQRLLVLGNSAYPIGGSRDMTVMLTPVLEDFAGTQKSFSVTVAEHKSSYIYYIDEDFETTPDGQLPEADEYVRWQGSITGEDENGFVGVADDPLHEGNKALRVTHHYPLGDKLYAANAYCSMNNYDTIEIEYDFYVVKGAMNNWPSPVSLGGYSTIRCSLLPTMAEFVGAQPIAYRREYPAGWNHMRLVYNTSSVTFSAFINGEEAIPGQPIAARNTSIGNVLFGVLKENAGDEYIDNVKVRVDAAEQRLADAFLSSVDFGDPSAIDSDVTLPAETPYGHVQIDWHTTNAAVIDTDGHVTRPEMNGENANESLYALIFHAGNWSYRKIDVTVLRKLTDEEIVAESAERLNLPEVSLLTEDLTLPHEGVDGAEIYWESSQSDIINPEIGKVTLPAYTGGKITEVTLTGLVRYGELQSQPRSFTFRVPDNNLALQGKLTASSATLDGWAARAADYDASSAWKMEASDLEKRFETEFDTPASVNYVTVDGEGEPELFWSANGIDFHSLGTGKNFTFPQKTVKKLRLQYYTENVSIREIGIYHLAADEQCVAMDAAALDLGDTSAVRSDLTIPLRGENGSDIVCTSDNTSVITSSGKVTRPAGNKDATVHLTFTFTKGEATKTITIPVTVKCTESGSGSKAPSGSNVVSSASDKRGGGGGGAVLTAPINGAESGEQQDTKPTETLPFTDISGNWARTEILSFYERGIVTGEEDGSFSPDRAVTRAEFVKLLLGAFGIETEEGSAVFADVSPSDWYAPYVKTAAKRGLVCGIDDERFAPLAQISRADMAVMLSRAWTMAEQTADAEGEPFADEASLPSYAQEAVKAMSSLKVLQGYPDGTYRPLESVSRAQAVAALYRLAEKLQ